MELTRDDVERLARIEVKIDTLLDVSKATDKRLSAVEKKQWYHSGGIAVVAFALTKLGLPLPWTH